jgi:hypothetical protein
MKVIALVVLAIALSTSIFGETLKGTVTDNAGAPISDAMILVHWDSAGSTVGLVTNVGIKKDLTIKADHHGSFAADLPAGFYDVFVSAMAFTPASRKVRILRAPVDFTLRMDVDPLITKELGNTLKASPDQ